MPVMRAHWINQFAVHASHFPFTFECDNCWYDDRVHNFHVKITSNVEVHETWIWTRYQVEMLDDYLVKLLQIGMTTGMHAAA